MSVVSGLLVVIVAMAALAACGNGNDKASPTTITAPHDTTALRPTSPPPTVGRLPDEVLPPRPWRTGFANGVMPLQLDDAELEQDLDGMAATGARWLRVDFYWPTVQQDGPQSWNWESTDRVVKAAHERGLEILAMPAYSPEWARPPGSMDHHPPLDPDWYARFVYEAAKRYSPLGVHAWEIWNEPNVTAFWPPRPDPEGYAELLKRAYVAIKSVDPKATVITAGLATGLDQSDGSTLSARTFLRRVYEAGAGGSFDAVGLHPAPFPALPTDPSDWNSFYNTPALYQVMADHGDARKKIWGTEFGTPTGDASNSVTPEFQRDILLTGYRTWVAWPFTGPLLVYSYRDYANDPNDREANYGLVRFDGTPKLALHAFEDVVTQLGTRPKRASG
jgi:polysaccharide biosynthesis protein PslG